MKALVTGGAGFLGQALIKQLLLEGHHVSTFIRSSNIEWPTDAVTVHRGDLTSQQAVREACKGVEVVFHAAAKAGGWGKAKSFEDSNILATDNVIDACRHCQVQVLVFTSSPSVVHADRDINGENESLPYATKHLADYPRTKAEAERRVRAAASASLRTVSLRPHLIWGPGDNHLLPRLVSRRRRNRLRQVGARDPLTDTVYIDNCVSAHILAAEKLLKSPLPQDVYFISDDAPIGLWTMANHFLECAGLPKIESSISASTAWAVATALEAWHRLFHLEREPLLTRFAVSQMTHAQWFDISAAKRDFGYRPLVSLSNGLSLLRQSLAPSPLAPEQKP